MNVTRATGWDREFILWELPLAHGLQIQHAEGLFQGETLDWADGTAGNDALNAADAMRAQFRAVRDRAED